MEFEKKTRNEKVKTIEFKKKQEEEKLKYRKKREDRELNFCQTVHNAIPIM